MFMGKRQYDANPEDALSISHRWLMYSGLDLPQPSPCDCMCQEQRHGTSRSSALLSGDKRKIFWSWRKCSR